MRKLFGGMILILHIILLPSFTRVAADSNRSPVNRAESDKKEDPAPGVSEESFIPQVDQLFKNPAVISGLQSTANAINKTVESLMDSLFYSLLDNQLKHPVSPELFYGINTQRDVYNTARGAYVIVDRVYIGPEARKNIGHINSIPIRLGSYIHTDMLNIYLRTDAQRLSEKESLPSWRYWINNWLGAIPLLSAIMPPSFNPNQMYNPLSLAETPFSFPLKKEEFYAMPVGSIRSYGLSGGVSLPFELSKLSPGHKGFLEHLDLKSELPYAIFVQGEFRLNVLRRSKDRAWVGLTKQAKSGHSLNGFLGNSFFLLAGAVSQLPWKGFPTVLAPLDMEWSAADISQLDHLYEFDMTNRDGVKAYKEAVRGNFSLAGSLASQKEKAPVIWHFTRNKKSVENTSGSINSYFIFRKERNSRAEMAEISITDAQGQYYILENTAHIEDSKWDILIGSEEITGSMVAELNVDKHTKKTSQGEEAAYYYTFKKTSPYHVTLSLNIKDRDADVEEFNHYNSILKTFSQLPLSELPEFSLRSDNRKVAHRRRSYFTDPNQHSTNIHVPITSLGKFNATAIVHFSTNQLRTIWRRNIRHKAAVFLELYSHGQIKASTVPIYPTETNYDKLIRYSLAPFNAFQLFFPFADARSETDHQLRSLNSYHEHMTPTELSKLFGKVFDTSYPAETAGALIRLAGPEKIPRKVTYYIKPGKYAEPHQKIKLGELNEKSFSSPVPFPALKRYQIARDKLTVFFPAQMKERRKTPTISHIAIEATGPNSSGDTGNIQVKVQTKNLPVQKTAFFYVRLETSGKIQIGNYVLGQDVIRLDPAHVEGPEEENFEPEVLNYSFYLTGSKSPLSGLIFDQLISLGGEFLLSVAVSADAKLWSKEKSFRFHFSKGELLPPGTGPES